MEVKATLIEAIGKSGKPYKAIDVQLTDSYKKRVFLESAELELLKMKNQSSNNENQIDNEFWK